MRSVSLLSRKPKPRTLVALLIPLALASPAWADGGSPARGTPPSSPATAHLERPDQPWLPGPQGVGSSVKVAPVVRGRFVSFQVNLDASGANVAGDAANEPSIAVDPTAPDRMVIGWRQFDNVSSSFRQAGVAWSNDGGRSWTSPGVLEAGTFRSDPVLEAGPDGRFFYYSARPEGELFLSDLFASDDGGQSWGARQPARGGDKPWLVVDRSDGIGRGNLYAVWSNVEGCCDLRTFSRSADGGASFAEPVELNPAPVFGTMTVGPDGELYLAGIVRLINTYFVVVRSDNAQDPAVWPPAFESQAVNLDGGLPFSSASNPEGLAGQVWVAADTSQGPTRGNVYLLCSVDPPGDDPLDVHFARSEDGGRTWSAPMAPHSDDRNASQWFGTLSVAPGGRVDVVWVESVDSTSPNLGELTYTSSDDGGYSWAQPVAVTPQFDSHLGWPVQQKLGDYYHMLSDDVGADLAYAATFNGEQDVYYLRIGERDCNRNGVADSVDIANRTSADCNADQVPDECEIAAAPKLDTNRDGKIDACVVPAAGPRRPDGRVTP